MDYTRNILWFFQRSYSIYSRMAVDLILLVRTLEHAENVRNSHVGLGTARCEHAFVAGRDVISN